MTSVASCSSSSTSTSENRLSKLKKQLSIGNIRRRLNPTSGESFDQSFEESGHLLEDMEDLTLIDKENNNAHNKLTKSKSQDDKPDSPSAKLHPIPSSLVTLTEAEKRQLEDVLMRIGLKDCGL